MKFSFYILVGLVIIGFLTIHATAADETWTTRLHDLFAGKNNLIRIHPAELNKKTRLTLTFANNDKELLIDDKDKLHIFFPSWWKTDQSTTPIHCSWSVNKDKSKGVTATWTGIDSSAPDQGPFITLVPTESFTFPARADLHILCDDLWTPEVMPSKERLDELKRKAKEGLKTGDGDLNDDSIPDVSQFGLVLINDNAEDAAIDRELKLDSDLKRLDSNSSWLLTISSQDQVKHGRAKKHTNKMKGKYHHAICAYVEKMAGIKHCKIKEESFAPDASVFTYTLNEPHVHTLDQLQSKFDNSPTLMQGFKKFVTDLLKLNSSPNIGLHQSLSSETPHPDAPATPTTSPATPATPATT